MAKPDLTTLDLVREQLQRTDPANTSQDDLLTDLIPGASEHIRSWCDDAFETPELTTEQRVFKTHRTRKTWLTPTPANTITAVALAHIEGTSVVVDSSIATTGWAALMEDGGVFRKVEITAPVVGWQHPDAAVLAVTGTWGYTTIPKAVLRATALLVASMVNSQNAWVSDVGAYAQTGGTSGQLMPLAVRQMLAPWKRLAVGA